MQRVVFNAHYLAWLDEVMAGWSTQAFGWSADDDRIDWMLVKLTLEWQGSATFGETVDVYCGIARWGTTSFEVNFRGVVGERAVFTARITYVCVTPGTTTKMVVPGDFRQALGPAPASAQPT